MIAQREHLHNEVQVLPSCCRSEKSRQSVDMRKYYVLILADDVLYLPYRQVVFGTQLVESETIDESLINNRPVALTEHKLLN